MRERGTSRNVTSQEELPPDIAELKLERGELLALIKDAISVAGPFRAEAKVAPINGKPCSPKSLLAVLTYCYALGIYGSRQIEEKLKADEVLRSIANECRPDHELLRQFRRAYRELIQECLKRTYWFIWVKYRVKQANYVLRVDDRCLKQVRGKFSLADKIHFESGECLLRATFEDDMMSD